MKSKNLYIEDDKKCLFPTRLKELMEKKNIRNTTLGSSLGKSKQSISQYRSGLIEPTLDTLIKIADVLDTTIDYLVGRTDDPNVQCSAVDDIGLSDSAIQMLKSHQYSKRNGYDLLYVINEFLSTPDFVGTLANVDQYLGILQAKQILQDLTRVLLPTLSKIDDPCATISDEDFVQHEKEILHYNNVLTQIIDSNVFGNNITSRLRELSDCQNQYRQRLDHIYALDALSSVNGVLNQLVQNRNQKIAKLLPQILENLDKHE